jgi:phosphopentomutase
VYTSADSVFQIAAHESIVPIKELYRCCEIARNILTGEHAVARVIARPFSGVYPNYVRTSNRHDYSLMPPKDTMLDVLKEAGKDVISVGKIYDIFAGKGVTETVRTKDNTDGMMKTLQYMDEDFEGLCFVNLVDFDMKYGHRNDVTGYAKAITQFDEWLTKFIGRMKEEDLLIITADHGCDPGAMWSTDHTREYTPMIAFGDMVKPCNLGTRDTFADIGATVLDYFGLDTSKICGKSFLKKLLEGDQDVK